MSKNLKPSDYPLRMSRRFLKALISALKTSEHKDREKLMAILLFQAGDDSFLDEIDGKHT